MVRKVKFAALLAVVMAVALAGIALARVPWNGNGSDSVTKCAEGQDPYLHWVLTPNGNQKPDGATLYVNGNAYEMGHRGGSAALHAVTPFYDPDTLTAYADETPEGSANNLVISDGCGTSSPQPSPSPSEEPTPEPSPSPSPSEEPSPGPSGEPTPTATPANPVSGDAPFTG
jgi:hypothetical protein